MKTNSLYYQGGNTGGNNEISENTQIFMYISLSTWLLLLITGWICFAVPDLGEKILYVWSYIIIRDNGFIIDYPLLIHYVLFYMILIPILLLIPFAFIVYLYHIFIKKDANVINGMLGLTKFHFIPLFCISILFIIGESVDKNKGVKGVHIFFNIFFSAIAIASLIYIYMQTNIEASIYATWIIKRGTYACLIALLIHNFFYNFWYYGEYLRDDEEYEKRRNWDKGCAITFSIFIGLVNLGISVFFKEIVIAIINLLMYIGMAIQFFRIEKDLRREYFSEGPGVIDIFMILFSMAAIAFIFIKYKGQHIS